MKQLPIVVCILVTLFFAKWTAAQTQTCPGNGPYESYAERPGEKTLKGILCREALTRDTSFKWYADGQKGYTPNKGALDGLRRLRDSIELLVFMGTWCEDSHQVIPKLYLLTDAAGYPGERITLIGVDRQKKTAGHLCEALAVTRVPTILVMKHGKEMGRVVEFGRYGLFDLDLNDIFKEIH